VHSPELVVKNSSQQLSFLEIFLVIAIKVRSKSLRPSAKECLVVCFMLGNRTTKQRIDSVIRIWALCRLVFQTTLIMLAAKHRVALHSMLVAQPLSIKVAFAFHCDVKKLKDSSLPEIIAAVNQLVDAAIEPTLLCDLPLHQPLKTPWQIKLVFFAQ
jgi:hypothetical protein